MGAEPGVPDDGGFALIVLDQLTRCRTESGFIAALESILHTTFPRSEVVAVSDPEAPVSSALAQLALEAWQAGGLVSSEAGMAVVGSDGDKTQIAVAVGPDAEVGILTDIAHIAGRLLPAIRAVQHNHPKFVPSDRPVLLQLRDLERTARLQDEYLAVGLVDPSVEVSLDAGAERARLSHRLRKILRPQDRVWEWDERLLVAQVLPEPNGGLLVDRLATAVRAAHAEAGVPRQLVDAWVSAGGIGPDAVTDLVRRADEGLARMASLRAAGMDMLSGKSVQEAFAGLVDAGAAVVVVDAQRMVRGLNEPALALFPEVETPVIGDAVDTDDLTFHRPDGSVLPDDELSGPSAMTTGLSMQDRLVGVRYRNFAMHWVLLTAVGLSDDAGQMLGYTASLLPVDVPEAMTLGERLRDAADLVRSPVAFMVPDSNADQEIVDFRVGWVNSATLKVLGKPESDVVGAAEGDLYPSEHRLGLVLDYASVLASGQAAREIVAIPDGGLLGAYDVTAEPCGDGVLVVAHSLASGSRRAEMARLWDSLTGLASRQGLLMRLEELQRRAVTPVTLVMCDIDDFTGVNDSLGRLRSDRYLIEVGRALAHLAGPHDLVARVGSDEFAFLTTSAQTAADAQHFAETVRRTLKDGVSVGDRRFTAASSLGVAWMPADGQLTELLATADVAMYRSKAAGGDCVTLGRDRKDGIGAVEMESELRAALENEEFVLHYQPIVDLADARIRGVEALIRWQHPVRGLVGPDEFIPMAERRHLTVEIGHWVIEEVCAQVRQWSDALGYTPRVSINVSTGQLARPGLATAIAGRAADAGVSPSALQLEITESQLLTVDRDSLTHLWACRDVGCELAIDDFGTGHAGFDYLRRIPSQVLKIDKTFIDGLGTDTTDTAIVSGVIAVGHGLGLSVVAEGVETQAQADLLKHLGCDGGQGWLWSPAVPAAEVLPLLRSGL